jgi:hypothetical protein
MVDLWEGTVFIDSESAHLLGTPVTLVGDPGTFCWASGSRASDTGPLCDIRVRWVLWASLVEQKELYQAALKYTMADAPTTTRIRSSIRMAGSSTTRSALPVVVECISRIPTVAR